MVSYHFYKHKNKYKRFVLFFGILFMIRLLEIPFKDILESMGITVDITLSIIIAAVFVLVAEITSENIDYDI